MGRVAARRRQVGQRHHRHHRKQPRRPHPHRAAAAPLAGAGAGPPLASRYGWGAVPMLSVYDKGTGLPLLPWSEKVVASGLVESQSLVEDGRKGGRLIASSRTKTVREDGSWGGSESSLVRTLDGSGVRNKEAGRYLLFSPCRVRRVRCVGFE